MKGFWRQFSPIPGRSAAHCLESLSQNLVCLLALQATSELILVSAASDISTQNSVKNQEFKMDNTGNDSVIKANLAAVEAHFHNEGLNEIEKACECYTDDIVWEAPARNLRFVNK